MIQYHHHHFSHQHHHLEEVVKIKGENLSAGTCTTCRQRSATWRQVTREHLCDSCSLLSEHHRHHYHHYHHHHRHHYHLYHLCHLCHHDININKGQTRILSDSSPITVLPCKSLHIKVSPFVDYCSNWICQSCSMYFSKFLDGFAKIDIWISLSCRMDLSKLIQVFL